ncbi:MAG: ATP-binding protein [Gemmatimonas sp.]
MPVPVLTTAPADDVARSVEAALAEMQFRFPARVWGNLVNAGLVAVIVREDVSPALLLGWFGLMAVVTTARFLVCMAFQSRRRGLDDAHVWVNLFAVGCAMSGALWGAASLIVWLSPNVTMHVFLAFVIAGMTAAAVAVDHAHPPSAWAYIVLATAPLGTSFLIVGGGMYLAMGTMVLLFMVLLVVQTKISHGVLANSLRLKEENRHLVSVLTASRDALEQRVRERTAELTDINAALQREMMAHQETSGRLSQVQKMEAIGQLTGGVAHDFNNILGVVSGNLELLGSELAKDAPQQELVERALAAVERGANLTRNLLVFARRQPLNPRPTDVNRLVAELIDLFRRPLGERIEVRSVLASGVWLCAVDPSQLEAALLNLLVNARDAMPDGGQLKVETANAHLDGAAAAELDLAPGEYVCVAVSDTGVGMSGEALQHAFEPFYTTKALGRGTGLGLAMVYGFVAQSGGQVKIDSEVARGTIVKMFLPRAATPVADNAQRSGGADPSAGRGESIMLVEDDDEFREAVTAMLTMAGYRVTAAATAEEALPRLKEERFDLLLTDVILPGAMNGHQLANAAVADRPGLKAMFMSGYTENVFPSGDRSTTGITLLQKPFRRLDLLKTIREVLAR